MRLGLGHTLTGFQAEPLMASSDSVTPNGGAASGNRGWSQESAVKVEYSQILGLCSRFVVTHVPGCSPCSGSPG
jgi:hypothetical protein